MVENQDIKRLLGKRIKELRVKKGMTQEQFAEMLSMGERNVSKIECGANFVTSATLGKILNVLEINAKELFDFEHHKDSKEMKKELLSAIKNETIDIKLFYKIYKALN